eukprot:c18182_g1_i3 orf=233-871(-)
MALAHASKSALKLMLLFGVAVNLQPFHHVWNMDEIFVEDRIVGKDKKGINHKRLRSFDEKVRKLCWQKADVVPGRHPERWRKDSAGNIVCRKFTGCDGCLCYEYDHILPFSKGGETDVKNCQILQSRVNRQKSDKEYLNKDALHKFSCELKFSDKELDIIEMAVYGNVIRPGLHCQCKSVGETLGTALRKSKGAQVACELPSQNAQQTSGGH